MIERFKLGPILEIEMKEILVMRVKAESGPSGAAAAFQRLESALGGNFRGRRFYGTLHKDEYWANVVMKEGDNPETLGLEKGVIPGGKYVKRKVKDYGDETGLGEVLPGAFESLVQEFQGRTDPNRPNIEYYQSHREQIIVIYLPIN